MIRILRGVEDRKKWQEALELVPKKLRDVYFHPDYVTMNSLEEGDSPILFLYCDQGFAWLYPFILRRLERVGSEHISGIWFDIETAYGYGGPLANTDDRKFLYDAHKAFSRWCNDTGVVAEFLRLHPLIHNERWLPAEVKCLAERETFSISLEMLAEGCLPFNPKTRNKIRRALREGVATEIRSESEEFEYFEELYITAMDRLGAAEDYYFSREYFRALFALTRAGGWLMTAEYSGEWLAGSVFLTGATGMHYHLSATASGVRIPGTTNLLLYQAGIRGLDQGLQWLHLGGGISTDGSDPLAIFKRSMATHSHTFYIGKRLHDPHQYASVCAIWSGQFPELKTTYENHLLCYRYTK